MEPLPSLACRVGGRGARSKGGKASKGGEANGQRRGLGGDLGMPERAARRAKGTRGARGGEGNEAGVWACIGTPFIYLARRLREPENNQARGRKGGKGGKRSKGGGRTIETPYRSKGGGRGQRRGFGHAFFTFVSM